MILYAPSASSIKSKNFSEKNTELAFRKNIYTKEIKDYIIELVLKKEKTRTEIVEKYHIPKNTLFRWLKKNRPSEERN